MNGGWQFDDAVADRFEREARSHIPNYESVVEKCIALAHGAFPEKRARIIDVGSATGYTLDRLKAAGFSDIHGVESSRAMYDRSRLKERVLLSETFPKAHGPFDMVLANWTLHFIGEREAYLRDVYDGMSPDGMLVLTDKMLTSKLVHDRYHDFKRSQGVSDEEIRRKEESLVDVLVPHPIEWYAETLRGIGFRDIAVIDAHWCFATLVASK